MLWIALFLMTAVLQVVCRDQAVCEIFPKNPVIPYGSNLTIFFKAPPSSDCRSKTPFSLSRIFWTLNNTKIDERFYDFNSTFASVSIYNLVVAAGTVECMLNATTPNLLDGTFIKTYPLFSAPENVSCISHNSEIPISITCIWDHDRITDINYIVHLKQKKEPICKTPEKKCTFAAISLNEAVSVSVTAQNSYQYSARSKEVTYNTLWHMYQMDSPEDVTAEPLPTGFSVSWKIKSSFQADQINLTDCEVQFHANGSHTKSVLEHGVNTVEVTEVKPCTNYTVFVRNKFNLAVWSEWSHGVTALSYINVSSLPIHLWRSKSVLGDGGKRTVHLMWKGVSPSCKAFDEYCVFSDSLNIQKCFGPYRNNLLITLDENPHKITVAPFRNKMSLSESSIVIPAMAKEVNLPPVGNISVFNRDGHICITWEKPSLLVIGYILLWNSTTKNHKWQQSLETSFTLKGEPYTKYTISLTPLYIDGPGYGVTLHNCSQDGKLMKVSGVQVTGITDNHAEIYWLPLLATQCCAFVLNYTVLYNTYNELKNRSITVGPNQHHVFLENLQAETTYNVYIMASTVAASSKTNLITFSTKSNYTVYLILIITLCVAVILLAMLAVMIQRKLSKNIPDPRLSSLSMWPSDSYTKPWTPLSIPGIGETEKILPCHVDSEVFSVFPTSIKNMAVVNALSDIQDYSTNELTTPTQNTPLAPGFSNRQLPCGGKEQMVPPVPSLDTQISEICSFPPIQTPYRKQTPLSSPVESPTKPLWSDEKEALLTPKLKNPTYFTCYIAVDRTEPEQCPTKRPLFHSEPQVL